MVKPETARFLLFKEGYFGKKRMLMQGVSYTHHDSNIHEIILHNVQHSTLDAFFLRLETIYDAASPHDLVRILVHTSQIGSIQYTAARNRELKKKYPHKHISRLAIIYPRTLSSSLLNIAARALTRSSSIRMFYKDQVAEARTWLAQ